MARMNGFLLLWFVRKNEHKSEGLYLDVSPERSILQPFFFPVENGDAVSFAEYFFHSRYDVMSPHASNFSNVCGVYISPTLFIL
jgi:hypothetical protein